ncbi:hypothetical protein [Nocardia jiangsuensis]|uniref:Nuclease-like protein n=1 Tax=Nocardia jiangsuensis TaxID=1691563 RepID=A0ABV8DNS9_9NOCA
MAIQDPDPGRRLDGKRENHTAFDPYQVIGVGPDGKPLPTDTPAQGAANPFDPTGVLGIPADPRPSGTPGTSNTTTPRAESTTTYPQTGNPGATYKVPRDLESLLLPATTDGHPGTPATPPPGIDFAGQLLLEYAPPGSRFEGRTSHNENGTSVTDWNLIVPGEEPTYWSRTQHVPLADGKSIDLTYSPDGTPILGAPGQGQPAAKVRLAGTDGEPPRWAVLNDKGEYLFTIDGAGIIHHPGPDGQMLGMGTGMAGGAAAGVLALTAGVEAAGTGAAAGAPLGPAGAVVGAGLTLAVAAGLTYLMYEQGMVPGTAEFDKRGTTPIDPRSIPEIAPPPRSTPAHPGQEPTTGIQPELRGPGTTTTRPAPADDPGTVTTPIEFPSAIPGQRGVPVPGTYWRGNALVWAPGNEAGAPAGTFAPQGKGGISLTATLFELKTWQLLDGEIKEEFQGPVVAAIAVVKGAELFRALPLLAIQALAPSADIGKLTSVDRGKREEELEALEEEGVNRDAVADALNAWWAAKGPEDRAKELLGEAGAIAVLKSDGWTVNARPKGPYTHDIVAVRDGEVIVVESKGGVPGRKPRPGDASVPDGPGSPTMIRAQQMTDPYLWAKLKQDAAADPEFKQWLIDNSVWDAVQNEDPNRVGIASPRSTPTAISSSTDRLRIPPTAGTRATPSSERPPAIRRARRRRSATPARPCSGSRSRSHPSTHRHGWQGWCGPDWKTCRRSPGSRCRRCSSPPSRRRAAARRTINPSPSPSHRRPHPSTSSHRPRPSAA